MRKSLFSDRRGTATIELALIAPILATMLIGMTDLARAYAVKLQTTQAAQRSIEKIMQTSFQTTAVDLLKQEAADTAGVATGDVTVDYWLQCNGVRRNTGDKDADYNGVCSTGQAYARYLSVEISKKFTPMFTSVRFLGANADGTYTVKGKAGIRTQ